MLIASVTLQEISGTRKRGKVLRTQQAGIPPVFAEMRHGVWSTNQNVFDAYLTASWRTCASVLIVDFDASDKGHAQHNKFRSLSDD